MITKIKIENFKKFELAEFPIGDSLTLLVGPNNGGKTTALQALSLWSYLAQQWDRKKGRSTGSRVTKRTGAQVTRNELYAVPVHDVKLLWHNMRTQGSSSERFDIILTAYGIDEYANDWEYGIRATYASQEFLYCSPVDVSQSLPADAKKIFHLPPLSGVQTNEQKLAVGAQNLAIGQGRPGEILRNILLAVQDSSHWREFTKETEDIFNLKLSPISFNPQTDANIIVTYALGETKNLLEISNAGSGFLQFLLLAGFMFVHKGAILLLDEPDSHMHVLLQRGVYGWLLKTAAKTGSQLIISTHSEVLINETDPGNIVTFFGQKPKLLTNRAAITSALKNLTATDIVNAEQKKVVLFAEGSTDLSLLKGFADVLGHPVKYMLRDVFFLTTGDNQMNNARDKFNSLKTVDDSVRGFFLRDRTAITASEQIPPGLTVKYWGRSEFENYLIYPGALIEFVVSRGLGGLFDATDRRKAEEYLTANLPPAVFTEPEKDTAILGNGSDFLAAFFEAMGIKIYKTDYWKITNYMKPEHVHQDIKTLLDDLESVLRTSPSVEEDAADEVA